MVSPLRSHLLGRQTTLVSPLSTRTRRVNKEAGRWDQSANRRSCLSPLKSPRVLSIRTKEVSIDNDFYCVHMSPLSFGDPSTSIATSPVMDGSHHYVNLGNNQPAGSRPPALRGYLSKWVNYKKGWRTRWFVLENGILSYYRTRDDEPHACRGSVSTSIAIVTPTNDKGRFEIHSKLSSSVPKIVVKSSDRAEAQRWMQAIKANVDYYSKHPSEAGKPLIARSESIIALGGDKAAVNLASRAVMHRHDSDDASRSAGDTIDLVDERSLADSADDENMPHEKEYELTAIKIKAQMELATGMVQSLLASKPSTTADGSGTATDRSTTSQKAIREALPPVMSLLSSLISQQSAMTQDRERYLLDRIRREAAAKKLWEENMLDVARQQAVMDRELLVVAQENEKKRRALKQARGVLADISASGSLPSSPAVQSGAPAPTNPLPPRGASITAAGLKPYGHKPRISIASVQEVQAVLEDADSDDSDDSDDDEFFDAAESISRLKADERILKPDWQRAGVSLKGSAAASPASSATSLAVPEDRTRERKVADSTPTMAAMLERSSLEPYFEVRDRLPNNTLNRPLPNLWSVIKSSVGKDLSNISLPVTFNEPISMLQRMAEDLEYDACLSVAASEQDSLKRIAYVAAFAMSNYSSTLGRIAKPFNPLLSESFEYAVPGRYRFIAEQVSHHPPISACYCEASNWKYYGEVETKQSFGGRSMEITPKGDLHVELVIPAKWVEQNGEYPAAGTEYGAGMVLEHFSWQKVKSCISNIIVGTPSIDHYGDLVVTNHRTGETCVLTFKPAGWRAKQAMEIKGSVTDAQGKVAWEIAGRWNTQLIARRAGASRSPLDSDAKFSQEEKEYMLLWRNGEKTPAPFSLTPFALSLNHVPEGLEPYLAPTDCRKRLDQRAVEDARYDRAQQLKDANEALQRRTRQMRAEGAVPPHEPRWFSESTDPDSQERLWVPSRAESGEVLYWAEREQAPEYKWDGVDQIFVED